MTNKTQSECVETIQKIETLFQLILVAENGLKVSEISRLITLETNDISQILHVMGMRGWIEKRNLLKRRAAWFVSDNFIRAAHVWNKPISPQKVKTLYRLMSTDLFCTSVLTGKALHVFNVVLIGGQEGKTVCELSKNLNYEITKSGYSVSTTCLILKSWEQLGWLSSVQSKGHNHRWHVTTKVLDKARQYENYRKQRYPFFNNETTGETL